MQTRAELLHFRHLYFAAFSLMSQLGFSESLVKTHYCLSLILSDSSHLLQNYG